MRLCRFLYDDQLELGLYDEEMILPLRMGAVAYAQASGEDLEMPDGHCLLHYLPPAGEGFPAAKKLDHWRGTPNVPDDVFVPTSQVKLLAPAPRPNKLFLLAGNYAAHIEEGGDMARERQDTFPYVFMKPPTTTLTHPGDPVRIPEISPNHIDWELELAVVIGKQAKGVSEAEALGVVAGYTVVNDISNRKFRPNPDRKPRPKDEFFDWLHGKWFDGFCPCGPCITSAETITDPQTLAMQLSVNGEVKQDASTAQQIFPVAAVIEFISSFVTLEPGDIISTGTAAGVGNTTQTYLKPGDEIEASISGIGTLKTPVRGE